MSEADPQSGCVHRRELTHSGHRLIPPEGREKGANPGFTQTPIVSAFKGLAISSRRSQGAFPHAAGFAMRYTPRPPRPRRRHRLLG